MMHWKTGQSYRTLKQIDWMCSNCAAHGVKMSLSMALHNSRTLNSSRGEGALSFIHLGSTYNRSTRVCICEHDVAKLSLRTVMGVCKDKFFLKPFKFASNFCALSLSSHIVVKWQSLNEYSRDNESAPSWPKASQIVGLERKIVSNCTLRIKDTGMSREELAVFCCFKKLIPVIPILFQKSCISLSGSKISSAVFLACFTMNGGSVVLGCWSGITCGVRALGCWSGITCGLSNGGA